MSTAEQPSESVPPNAERSSARPAQPDLYDPGDPTPQLAATTCGACGAVSFPPMTVGCEVCGASENQLAITPIAAAGIVHSVATVHLHHGKDIEAPFTMAEVKLDDGPLIRATMLDVVGVDAIGERVGAEWFQTHTDDEGVAIVEPRFAISSRPPSAPSPSSGGAS